jgi:polyferredoxin
MIKNKKNKIKTKKIKTKLRYPRYIKYVILGLFVIILPLTIRHELSGLGSPWFCANICPSGTIFAATPILAVNEFLHSMIGMQFYIKAAIAAGIILTSVVIFRFFCRVLCPLGAIYALFNKFAFLRMHHNKEKCVSCEGCNKACHMRLEPSKQPNSPECIRCGNCIKACDEKALGYRK